MQCPSCSTENPTGVKFCGECGTRLPMAPEDARAILEIAVDTDTAGIEARYRSLHGEIDQMRREAPTALLRDRYQKRLTELAEAAQALGVTVGSEAAPVPSNLPSVSPVEVAKNTPLTTSAIPPAEKPIPVSTPPSSVIPVVPEPTPPVSKPEAPSAPPPQAGNTPVQVVVPPPSMAQEQERESPKEEAVSKKLSLRRIALIATLAGLSGLVLMGILVLDSKGRTTTLDSNSPHRPAPTGNIATDATTTASDNESFTNSIGMQFVTVGAGSFTMGDTVGGGETDEKPLHQVSLSEFMMGATEVTQAQYRAVMGTNPSNFKGAQLPVETVSWYDAVNYCNALSKKEGQIPAYTVNGTDVSWNRGANGYRLPTEAEWEYAAKGGTWSAGYTYAGSQSAEDVGWYYDKSGMKTHPVGQKRSNELGLYDMSGNVYEWCWDWYGEYSAGNLSDPTGAPSGTFRVRRGGGLDDYAVNARSSNRFYYIPTIQADDLGFRIVCPPVQ